MIFTSAFIILFSSLFSWIIGFSVFRFLASVGVVDQPNDRSSHTQPTVRGGGISIVVPVLVGVACLISRFQGEPLVAIGLSVMLLAIVSFIDDLKSLGAATRFGCHFLAAVVAWYALGISDMSLTLSETAKFILPQIVGTVFGILWITGYTNAFNFMDGINGIAVGQAAVTSLGAALLVSSQLDHAHSLPLLVSVCLAGATLGFLPHNFPQARMFMGDVGSAPIGFLLAVLTLWMAKVAGWWMLIPLTLLHANFVLDTAITLVRRVLRGDRWYDAHREHFYQRLIRSGRSHTFVTLLEMGLQLLVLGLMLCYLSATPLVRMILILTTIGIWLSFFIYCESCFRRCQRSSAILRTSI